MQTKTSLRFHIPLVRMVIINKQMTTNVGKGKGKEELLLFVRLQTGAAIMIIVVQVSQKAKTQNTE